MKDLNILKTIKVLQPNAKKTYTVFNRMGQSKKITSDMLAVNPLLVLKTYPGLRAETTATHAQMSLIEKANRAELIRLQGEMKAQKAADFQKKEVTKTNTSK